MRGSHLVVGEQLATVEPNRSGVDHRAETAVGLDEIGEQVALEIGPDAVDERGMLGPHRLIRHPVGPHLLEPFDRRAERDVEHLVDEVGLRHRRAVVEERRLRQVQCRSAVDEHERPHERRVTLGEQQRDVRAHRVADHDHRTADLFDHRGDVVGVLAESDRAGLLPAPTTPAQVDGHQIDAAVQLMGDRIPRPCVGGDAVDRDDGRRTIDAAAVRVGAPPECTERRARRRRTMVNSGVRDTREPQHAFTEDVAHHVRRAAHDRVARAVDEAPRHVGPQHAFRAEHLEDELGDVDLVLGAEALRRGGEPGRRLPQHFAGDEDAAEPIARSRASPSSGGRSDRIGRRGLRPSRTAPGSTPDDRCHLARARAAPSSA